MRKAVKPNPWETIEIQFISTLEQIPNKTPEASFHQLKTNFNRRLFRQLSDKFVYV